MQIMNLEKLAKELWWSLTAFRTINELPDSVIFVNDDGIIERVNSKAKECFGIIIDELNPPKLNDYIKDGMDMINLSILFSLIHLFIIATKLSNSSGNILS